MNAGQILVQMPVAATQPVAAQANSPAVLSPAGNQEKSVFDGVLCGVSPRDSVRPTSTTGAGKTVHADTDSDTDTPTATIAADLQSGTPTVALATLMAVLGTGTQTVPSVPTDAKACEEKPKTDVSAMCPYVLKPQNVVFDAVQFQNGLPMQINGRMPEAEQKDAVNSSESSSASRAVAQPLSSVTAQLVIPETKESITRNHAGNSGETAVVAPVKATERDIKTVSQIVVAAKDQVALEPRIVVRVIQGGSPVTEPAAVGTFSAATVSQNMSRGTTEDEVPKTLSSSIVTTVRNTDAFTQAATNLTFLSNPVSTTSISLPQAVTTDSPKEASALPSALANAETCSMSGTGPVQNVPIESSEKPAVSATSSAPPEFSDTVVASVPTEKTVAEPSVQTNMEAYFQTSVRPVATAGAVSSKQAMQAAVTLPVTDTPAEIHPITNASQRQVHGDTRQHNEFMAVQEQPAAAQGPTEKTVTTEAGTKTSVAGAVKEVNTSNTAEEFDQSGSGSGDQKMTGNAHLALSQLVKSDNALPASGVSADVIPADTLRSGQAAQLVSQVKGQLSGREIKSGSEQIVIKLSPENLGELKLNLRMENQSLKVEIVTETPMVRDTLMKHAESLKESLARQNITMESFDVSTGSNKQDTASQSQGDWRELTKQRHHNSWASTGGYKLSDVPEIPLRPSYQVSADHSMLDVHF